MSQGEFVVPNFRPRASRPRLGPALWCSGVLLWAYTALGRLVVNQDFPEALAVLILLCCFGVAAFCSFTRSAQADPPASDFAGGVRLAQTIGLSLAFFGVAVGLSALLGLTSRDDLDEPLSALLVLLSLGAVLFGRRVTGARSVPSAPLRALNVLVWIGSLSLTLLAWSR